MEVDCFLSGGVDGDDGLDLSVDERGIGSVEVYDRSLLAAGSGLCVLVAAGERMEPVARDGELLEARDADLGVPFSAADDGVDGEGEGDLSRRGRRREADDTVLSRMEGWAGRVVADDGGGGGWGTSESVMNVSNRRVDITCSRLRWDKVVVADIDEALPLVVEVEVMIDDGSSSEATLEARRSLLAPEGTCAAD